MLYDRTKPIPKDSLVAPEPILDHTKTTDAIDSPIPNIEVRHKRLIFQWVH